MDSNEYRITRNKRIRQLHLQGVSVEKIAENLAIETDVVRSTLGMGIKLKKNYVLFVKKCDRLDPI